MTEAKKTTDPEKKEQKKVRKVLRRLSIKIAVYGVLAFLSLYLVIGIYQIHSNEMFPSLRDGDLIVTYKLGGYYTGDVVAYRTQLGEIHYGRIAAVGGDVVQLMSSGHFEVNGSIPYEDIFYPTYPRSGSVSYPLTVEEGHVFILGDMRQQAVDSRSIGAVPLKSLRGKCVLLLFRGRGF